MHQLIHSCRLQEFDDQVALIDDITHVIEITMILDEHIKKLFFYVTELNQYLIIMSLSWLHHHVIDINFEHNILILSFFFCFNHYCQFLVKIYDLNQQEENFSLKVNKVASLQPHSQLNWSLSWVSNWHFELESRLNRVAHIFNSTRVELLIFSTWRDSIQLRIESIQLDLSRTQAWCQEN